jgi:hypothetical protein
VCREGNFKNIRNLPTGYTRKFTEVLPNPNGEGRNRVDTGRAGKIIIKEYSFICSHNQPLKNHVRPKN